MPRATDTGFVAEKTAPRAAAVDPVVAASGLVTMIIDVVGFFAFLGLAVVVLL